MNTPSDLVRQCFAAYETRDRNALEALLSDDFTFSSPLDDNISRAKYFERCWPSSAHFRAFHLEKVFAEGDEVFVTYTCEGMDGGSFRNTEFFQTEGGKIRHVDVYFGSETGQSVDEAEIRALVEDTAKACRAKDAAALMAHYAPEVIAFDLLNPLQYRGAEEVGKRAAAWFASWQGELDYEVSELSITTSGETAFCHSLNHARGTQSGGQAVDMWWRATLCCRKLDGKWTVTHSHSSVPFNMESMQASLDLKP